MVDDVWKTCEEFHDMMTSTGQVLCSACFIVFFVFILLDAVVMSDSSLQTLYQLLEKRVSQQETWLWSQIESMVSKEDATVKRRSVRVTCNPS